MAGEMKTHRTSSAAPLRGMARFRAAHHIPTNPAPRRLQQALAVAAELQQALETSQSESKAVRLARRVTSSSAPPAK